MSQLGQRQGDGRVLEVHGALTEATTAAVQRFGDAFNRHDLDAVIAAMTEDCALESTFPQPDGTRYEGHDAIRDHWEELFRTSPQAAFETEEMFAAGDRCVFRWMYRWIDNDGKPGHLRGMDVFRVRDGKVAEKLVYAKANPKALAGRVRLSAAPVSPSTSTVSRSFGAACLELSTKPRTCA